MFCAYGCGNEGIFKLKNGKLCCHKSTNQCPAIRKKNSDKNKNINRHATSLKFFEVARTKTYCQYCGKIVTIPNKKHHEKYCFLNPFVVRFCYCGDGIKNKDSKTCSYKCSNSLFKQAKNSKKEIKQYTTICFKKHKKECVICKENRIVAVHHYDYNKNNNKPDNLIPLCTTHHLYMHSKYRWLLKECVDEYREKFLRK
jgi:hypothetical protein